MGSEISLGSSQLESVERPRRSPGWCPGGQREVGEELGDHGGIFDACPEPVEGAVMILGSAAVGQRLWESPIRC